MAIENCTCTTKEPDALWAVLEIHECVTPDFDTSE